MHLVNDTAVCEPSVLVVHLPLLRLGFPPTPLPDTHGMPYVWSCGVCTQAYKNYAKVATNALKAVNLPKNLKGMKGDMPMNMRNMQQTMQKLGGALPPQLLQQMGGMGGLAELMKGMGGGPGGKGGLGGGKGGLGGLGAMLQGLR